MLLCQYLETLGYKPGFKLVLFLGRIMLHLVSLPEISTLNILDEFSGCFSSLVNVTDIEEHKNFRTASLTK